ncbi:MAG: VCBS repeat-containing protein [Planctomycetota bacterium]|nr:VCBS repeat-containing protein [Planctomycetota bacterium]
MLPLTLLLLASTPIFQDSSFQEETVGQLEIGYGVAIGDVDGDGRPDLLVADKRELAWYRSPKWDRHVLARDLTERDNVCIAARDLDGDGKVEVAVGGAWNPGDTQTSGSIHYLVAPQDRTQPWAPIALPHEPTVHRMRWVRVGEGRCDLVVAPLHGRGNKNAQGAGVRLLAYRPPADPTQPWSTTLLDDTLHVTHNLDSCQWEPETEAEEVLFIGLEGALLIERAEAGWSRRRLEGLEGGGEIRMGRHADGTRFVATIAPFHGNRLLVHHEAMDGTFIPTLLDDTLRGGHAIAVADLVGDAGQEIVAGWREPNPDGEVGIKLFQRTPGGEWKGSWIDRGGMATEDLRLADLDGDGRVDIVAAGRSTKNLKVYWNREEN